MKHFDCLGLNQFDSNPTNDGDLFDFINEHWLRKAFYYALKKSRFKCCKTWVIIDGVRYDISIERKGS